MTSFDTKAADRATVVGVMGLGYVGLPLALVFAEAGFQTIGFDVDQSKVDALNEGRTYIKHIGADRVARVRSHQRLTAATDFERLRECDAALICVPTPLGRHHEPDNSYIHATVREIAVRLHPGMLVVLESTTYPGTTDEEVLPILEATGLRTPGEFLLAFSPEREDPGNKSFTTRTIPKVVGGVNQESTSAAMALYGGAFERVVPVSSARVAEATKLLENIYRSVNIALVNELKMTLDAMGIDVWEVIEAARTKPFGFSPFHPGPGLGGHCIPIDPFYLTWKAAEYGRWTRFVELAGEINTQMPRYVFQKIGQALNERCRSIRGSRVLVLGLAYKADIDDDRESPSYEVIEMLGAAGAEVSYCDPHFPETKSTRRHDLAMRSVSITADSFAGFDLLVMMTAHEEFKDPALYSRVDCVVDSRNLVRPEWGPTVVRA